MPTIPKTDHHVVQIINEELQLIKSPVVAPASQAEITKEGQVTLVAPEPDRTNSGTPLFQQVGNCSVLYLHGLCEPLYPLLPVSGTMPKSARDMMGNLGFKKEDSTRGRGKEILTRATQILIDFFSCSTATRLLSSSSTTSSSPPTTPSSLRRSP